MDNLDSQQTALSEQTNEIPSSENRSRAPRRIFIFVVCLFALIGLTVAGALAYGFFHVARTDSRTIDEADAVEQVMETIYGKYSSSQRGWTYVSESGNTYLVTVVQQKKIDEARVGDVLYLVASGTRIASGTKPAANDEPGTLYGVFKVTSRKDRLYIVSSAYNFSEAIPLAPERVKFEAFNADHWGWVLKQVFRIDGEQSMDAQILIPDGDEVREVARFHSEFDNTSPVQAVHGSCENANAAYIRWKEKSSTKISMPKTDIPLDSEGAEDEDAHDKDAEVSEPMRCSKYRISYRTDPVGDKLFTPLYLTLSADFPGV